MDMQNVSNLQIPEGTVRTIHDKDNRLIWGRVNYDTKYAGDTLQNGAPTPDAPIPVQTVTGEQTVMVTGKNIFDQSWFDTNVGTAITYKTYGVPNGTYTMSTNMPLVNGTAANVFVKEGTTISPSSANNGVSATTPRTFTVSNGYYTVGYRTRNGAKPPAGSDPKDYNWQVNLGSTATAYEPYQSQSYTISLGPLELCKIGNYQDYIYKSSDDWYLHKACMNRILDSSSEWGVQGYGGYTYISGYNQHYFDDASTDASNITVKSSQFTPVSWDNRTLNIRNSIYINLATPSRPRLEIRNVGWASVADVVTWFTAHPAIIYYALATPTDTKITDATLVGQLDAVHQWATRYGYNTTVSGDLPIVLQRDSLQ